MRYSLSILMFQGDLVVRGEEFSLYGAESDGEQATMDQITPLIDTCADLSYRLDTHARLCVQYTADQVCVISVTSVTGVTCVLIVVYTVLTLPY